MLYLDELPGTIACARDDAGCVLDGQASRRAMTVSGTGGTKLTLRALTFTNSQNQDGGLRVDGGVVDVVLSIFQNFVGHFGVVDKRPKAGSIYVAAAGSSVSIYASVFAGNTVSYTLRNGGECVSNCYCVGLSCFFNPKVYADLDVTVGADIYSAEGATTTVYDTCPSPYTAKASTQGKEL
jgi:hypothetical protein